MCEIAMHQNAGLAGRHVVAGERDIFALPEDVGFETEERFIVFLARRVGKRPGAVAGMDQVAFLGIFVAPEPFDGAGFLVDTPGFDVDLTRSRWSASVERARAGAGPTARNSLTSRHARARDPGWRR